MAEEPTFPGPSDQEAGSDLGRRRAHDPNLRSQEPENDHIESPDVEVLEPNDLPQCVNCRSRFSTGRYGCGVCGLRPLCGPCVGAHCCGSETTQMEPFEANRVLSTQEDLERRAAQCEVIEDATPKNCDVHGDRVEDGGLKRRGYFACWACLRSNTSGCRPFYGKGFGKGSGSGGPDYTSCDEAEPQAPSSFVLTQDALTSRPSSCGMSQCALGPTPLAAESVPPPRPLPASLLRAAPTLEPRG